MSERGIIKIDGALIPGHFEKLVVGQYITIDAMQVQGKNDHKQPTSCNDGTIHIELDSVADDGNVHTQLASIYSMFRKIAG